MGDTTLGIRVSWQERLAVDRAGRQSELYQATASIVWRSNACRVCLVAALVVDEVVASHIWDVRVATLELSALGLPALGAARDRVGKPLLHLLHLLAGGDIGHGRLCLLMLLILAT